MSCNSSEKCLRLLSQLKDHSNDFYINVLKEHESDIVEILGGLDNLLQYCLSDEKFVSTNLNDDKLIKLECLLDIDINDINKSQENMNNTNMQSFSNDTNFTVENLPSNEKIIEIIDVDVKEDVSNTNTHKDGIKIDKYYESSNIYLVNVANTFYFEHFSIETATKLYYRVALNKKLLHGLVAIMMIWLVVFGIVVLVHGHSSDVRKRVLDMECIFVLTIICNLLLAINYDISKLAMQTFDFWFKLYNLLTGMIGYFVYEYTSVSHAKEIESWNFYSWFHIILWWTTWSLTLMCLFLMDAINITTKSKLAFSFVASSACMYSAINLFFFYPNDAYIDPFGLNSNYTIIGIKNIRVGAFINLGLFAAKPLYRRLFYCLIIRKCAYDEQGLSNEKKKKGVKAQVLYQRPFLRWKFM